MYGEVLLEVPSAEIGEMDESHSVPELGKAATQALAGSSVVGSVKGHVEVVTLHQLPHLVPVLEAVGGGSEGHLDPSPAPGLRHVLHRHEHVATPTSLWKSVTSDIQRKKVTSSMVLCGGWKVTLSAPSERANSTVLPKAAARSSHPSTCSKGACTLLTDNPVSSAASCKASSCLGCEYRLTMYSTPSKPVCAANLKVLRRVIRPCVEPVDSRRSMTIQSTK